MPFHNSNDSNTETNLLSAKLRLYTRATPVPKGDDEFSNFSLSKYSDDDDDDILRDSMTVTLFQYLKPLKGNRRGKAVFPHFTF